jgi:hypothetical protein
MRSHSPHDEFQDQKEPGREAESNWQPETPAKRQIRQLLRQSLLREILETVGVSGEFAPALVLGSLLGVLAAWLLVGFIIAANFILSENVSAFGGFYDVSATRYRGLENVSVRPIIISESELRNVKWPILGSATLNYTE